MTAQQAVVTRLQNLCKQNKVTVNRLAYESGVAPSTVKNIFYGTSANTGVVTIAKLCDGLDITLKEFFDDELFVDLEQEIY